MKFYEAYDFVSEAVGIYASQSLDTNGEDN